MTVRPDGIEARLERRPEATSYLVDDLMELVREGRVRVPAFQRGLRWKDRDRIDLFDSIYKGYPIGTLLLWKRDGGTERVTFGDFAVDASKIHDALFLVDGQQRVTTLATTLLVSRGDGKREMVFDLKKQEFRHARVRSDGASSVLPSVDGDDDDDVVEVSVRILFDSSALIQWLASGTARSRALVDTALECGKRLREYRVPATIVESASLDVLRIVFDRTNRTGKRLDEVDVFNALLATLESEGQHDLKGIVRRIENVGFGALPESTVLKALRAIEDLPLDKDFTKELKPGDVPEALDRTEVALERTVRFLKTEAQIPHFVLNPYELPIVVLARFFDRFPEPSPRSRLLLRRWIWRGSLAGQLTGASVSLRQHVDAVQDGESESVQRILMLNQVSPDVLDIEMGAFTLSTARTSLFLCALASLEPRDLRDGSPLELPTLLSTPDRAILRIARESQAPLAGTMASRLLHPTIPPKGVIERVLEADEATLASHAILPDALDALRRDDVGGFFEHRARRIQIIARAFFSSLAEIGADDSRPIESIQIEEGE